MFQYIIEKIAAAVMSMALGASIIISVCSLTAVGLARNDSFVTLHLTGGQTQLIEDIDDAASTAAACAGLPEEALTGAVDSANYATIAKEIARMFTHSYSADYSESAVLYDIFYRHLSDYANQNNIAVSEQGMVSAASLAVNYVNNMIAGSDTANVALFRFASDSRVLYPIGGAIVMGAVAIAVIAFLTRGRHRQFSYYGMSLNIAGYVMVLLPLALMASGVLNDFRYCVNDAYNAMMVQCYNAIARIILLAGIPFIVAGTVMLLINYNYYRKKLLKVKESREKLDKIREEYMETPKVRAPLTESEKAKKTFLDIDFDE